MGALLPGSNRQQRFQQAVCTESMERVGEQALSLSKQPLAIPNFCQLNKSTPLRKAWRRTLRPDRRPLGESRLFSCAGGPNG